jgi:hypothetical protein
MRRHPFHGFPGHRQTQKGNCGMQASIMPWLDKRRLMHGEGPPRRKIALIWDLIFILYSLEIGIALICLPWLDIWENNYLLYLYPKIRSIVANSFFKGAVLGLGIANIMIGIREVVQLWKSSREPFSR